MNQLWSVLTSFYFIEGNVQALKCNGQGEVLGYEI